MMLGAAAMMSTACDDDASNDSKKNDPIDNVEVQDYTLTCSNDCVLELDQGSTGTVTVMLAGRVNAVGVPVANATIHAQISSGDITLDGGNTQVDLVTNETGFVTFQVNALDKAGSAVVVISSDAVYPTSPLMLNVTVKEKSTVDPVVPSTTTVNYTVKMTYSGARSLSGVAIVGLYPAQTCNQLVKSGMSQTEVRNIVNAESGKQNVVTYENVEDLASKTVTFPVEEDSKTTYAVVARAQNGSSFAAYGCTDAMSRDYPDIVVNLGDSFMEQTDVDDPDNPDNPDPDNPDNPVVTYNGVYTLTSSFDALSLLPRAAVEEGKTPQFSEMLLGDWIQFGLDFLSNPEEKLPDILIKQVLPLLTNAEWFHNLLLKIPNYGEMIAGLLDNLDVFLEQFGVTKMLEDTLTKLTDQISWWDDATSGVTVVNQLATNFTLQGSFTNNQSKLNDNKLSGVNHSYDKLLYNAGSFDCLTSISSDYGMDANGKNKICAIDISTLGEKGSIRGNFTAEFSEITGNVGTVDIEEHTLSLAYAKLIYAVLIKVMNQFVTTENDFEFTSIGDILAYYVGYGLVSLYNKDLAEDDTTRISNVTGCDAVGYAAVGFINRLIENYSALENYKNLISVFLQPTFISSACTTGISAINNLIDKQLDSNGYLSVSSNNVIFSSEDCEVGYVSNGNDKSLAYFGTDDYTWGSSVDKRCNWEMRIDRGEETPLTVEGKFWAFTNK